MAESFIRLNPRQRNELRWYWHESYADMGISSNFSAVVSVLQMGGPSGHQQPHFTMDDRHVAAAGRAVRVEKALRELTEHDRNVLWAAHGESRVRPELLGFGQFGNVAVFTLAAREDHTASGTKKHFLDWLGCLTARLSKGTASEQDRTVRQRIMVQADRLLSRASSRYLAALRAP